MRPPPPKRAYLEQFTANLDVPGDMNRLYMDHKKKWKLHKSIAHVSLKISKDCPNGSTELLGILVSDGDKDCSSTWVSERHISSRINGHENNAFFGPDRIKRPECQSQIEPLSANLAQKTSPRFDHSHTVCRYT